MGNGTVTKNTGSNYLVKATDGSSVNCKVKGNFRLKGIRTTNPVAVGDEVRFTAKAHPTAYITAHTSTTFIDRFLATAEAYSVPVIIVVNKTDLLDDDELEYVEAVRYLYTGIGYEVLTLSATGSDDATLTTILDIAKDRISLIAGNSGVGKSTIINRLIPGLNLRTGNVSASHHTGMHTTTFSEMHPLPCGGYIIDTPGVKGFGTVDFGDDVAHYFREIFSRSADCRYGNCTHTHEPGCAVREAVERHEISESRYASYLSILDDKDEGKYRKAY